MNRKQLFNKLKALPDPSPRIDSWLDYGEMELSADDCGALVELAEDYFVNFEQSVDEEKVAIHAWRALSVVSAEDQLPEVVAWFVELAYDSQEMDEEALAGDLGNIWEHLGLKSLPIVLESIEESEGHTLLVSTFGEGFARAVANDQDRKVVLEALVSLLEKEYLDRYDRSHVIASLIDLKGIEHIDRIRNEYAAHRVDVTLSGDIEDVEILLGLRETRETPSPNLMELEAELERAERKALAGEFPSEGTEPEKLQYFLARYGESCSIAGIDELDGFLLALSLSGEPFTNRQRSALVWDTMNIDDGFHPKFESQEERSQWSQCLRELAKRIEAGLEEATYEPYVCVWPDAADSMDPEAPFFTPWLNGYLKGDLLVGPDEDSALVEAEESLAGLALSMMEEESDGIRLLEDSTDNPIFQFMVLVQERFEKRLAEPWLLSQASELPMVAEDGVSFDAKSSSPKKVERNAPCPCGSGLKYKKCCLN